MKPITKLEAVRRQLETALELYGAGRDEISIHTLAAAADGILRPISQNRALDPPMISQAARTLVKPESQKLFFEGLYRARNFFKHADRDADAVLDGFEPMLSEILLLDCVTTYRRLAGTRPPIFGVFEVWAITTFAKDWVLPEVVAALHAADCRADSFAHMSREEFFAFALPVAGSLDPLSDMR